MSLSFIKYFPSKFIVFLICFYHANSTDFKDSRYSGPSGNMFYPTVSACYNKFVGSKGSIQSPVLLRAYRYPVDCLWDIDVTDSRNIEFDFEIFSLPKSGEHECESYVELSYMKNQDGMTKRVFCPNDLVDKIYVDSNTVHLRFHAGKYIEEYENDSYGFKINYNAIPVDKPIANYAGTIVLVCFASLFIITVCIICIRSHRKTSRIGQIPSHMVIPAAPNAPTRADLQSAFDFHLRELTQAPVNESRYLSRTTSHNVSDLADRRDVSNPPQKTDDRKLSEIFIATTPRSVFPVSRRVVSADSARRIADLRTRLVARFSSVSSNESSDRSVFLSALDQMEYSQLTSAEEKTAEEERPRSERRRSAVGSGGKNIPSIVIEFFK